MQLIVFISRIKELEQDWNDSLLSKKQWKKIYQKNLEDTTEIVKSGCTSIIPSDILNKLYMQYLSHTFSSSLFDLLCIYQTYRDKEKELDPPTKAFFWEFNPYDIALTFYKTASSEKYFFDYIYRIFDISLSSKCSLEQPKALKSLGKEYQLDTINLSLIEQLQKLNEKIISQEKELYNQISELEQSELEKKFKMALSYFTDKL